MTWHGKLIPTPLRLRWPGSSIGPSITAPIVSATTREQLQDLIQAPQLELSQEALEKLTKASQGG